MCTVLSRDGRVLSSMSHCIEVHFCEDGKVQTHERLVETNWKRCSVATLLEVHFCEEAFSGHGEGVDEVVGDGISEDPSLRREPSQCKYGSCINKLECVGEDDCKIGEVGERELVLVVSSRSGKNET